MALMQEVEYQLHKGFRGDKWQSQVMAIRDTRRADRFAKLVKRGTTKFRQAIGFRRPGHLGGVWRGLLRKNIERRENPEAKLERMLVAAKDGLFNQFNFLSGLAVGNRGRTMNIDLVRAQPETRAIREFFELKSLSPDRPNYMSDSPIHAMVELLSYYYLYLQAHRRDRRLPDLHRRITLTILGPKNYYDRWSAGEAGLDVTALQDLARVVSAAMNDISKRSDEPKVTVRFLAMDISKEHVSDAHEALKDISEEFDRSCPQIR
jgi:hypothetical protein